MLHYNSQHVSSSTLLIFLLLQVLQSGMGLGLLYNMPPGLSIPCCVSPFVYTHLSQVHGHVIQPSHFWSSPSSCCLQLPVHFFWDCCLLHSFYMNKPSYSLALINLTMFSPLIMASNSSFLAHLQEDKLYYYSLWYRHSL